MERLNDMWWVLGDIGERPAVSAHFSADEVFARLEELLGPGGRGLKLEAWWRSTHWVSADGKRAAFVVGDHR